MKRIFPFFAIALSLILTYQNANAQCRRHIEPVAGITYCPPAGWKETAVAGETEKRFVGPGAAMISFVALDQDMTAHQLADDFVKTALKDTPEDPFKKKRLVNRSAFPISPKLKVVKLVVNGEAKSLPLYQVIYYFEGPGKRRIMGMGAGQKKFFAQDELLIEAAMKSMILTR